MGADFVFPKDSTILRAIGRVWPELLKGVCLSVGNGRRARFWHDTWLHQSTPLLALATGPIPADQWGLPMASFVAVSGGWNWGSFAHLLPANVLLRIASVMPPNPHLTNDAIYWGFSDNGRLTTKSAYESLLPLEPKTNRVLWKSIWQWVGPQRIRQFLWLAAQYRLLTNRERTRRPLTSSPTCTLCGWGEESVMHALRDCTGAAQTPWIPNIKEKKPMCQFESDRRNLVWVSDMFN
ncbi:Unknown protein [Striga hermonthica]|uniref:Reverse transcriptase zinc-binding domain-containing protein n=1 Tax=Striga hermonthica TaxID=68872 RepID=A0A9N7N8I5_STRHE|nr:Unknown protein [Striga hermonthica]